MAPTHEHRRGAPIDARGEADGYRSRETRERRPRGAGEGEAHEARSSESGSGPGSEGEGARGGTCDRTVMALLFVLVADHRGD